MVEELAAALGQRSVLSGWKKNIYFLLLLMFAARFVAQSVASLGVGSAVVVQFPLQSQCSWVCSCTCSWPSHCCAVHIAVTPQFSQAVCAYRGGL